MTDPKVTAIEEEHPISLKVFFCFCLNMFISFLMRLFFFAVTVDTGDAVNEASVELQCAVW